MADNMAELICFKCGAKRIDDGRNFVLVALGGAVLAACVYAYVASFAMYGEANWTTVMPMHHVSGNVIIGSCIGLVLLVCGLERGKRVKCRECGTVWTPPRQLSSKRIREQVTSKK